MSCPRTYLPDITDYSEWTLHQVELSTVAAPRFAPVSPVDLVRSYESPDSVPSAWSSDRPGEVVGRQAGGDLRGYQGPDQGYVLTLAERYRPQLQIAPGEKVGDAIRGCVNIALRRAALFGRAPVIHDLTVAFTMWGWLDAKPTKDLLERRHQLFEGVANANHHYAEGRHIADLVSDDTLRMTPAQIEAAYPAQWREITGA